MEEITKELKEKIEETIKPVFEETEEEKND